MEVTFKHTKTFRYEIINGGPEAKTVLYVLHGYGQLAKHFIQKFTRVPKDIMIVAPEAMHRFYNSGTGGRVGASWMTKEMREVDIADNIACLDALDAKISEEYSIERKYLLGFSQGGSTAIRWKIHGKPKFDSLIVWASSFPPEEIDNAGRLMNSSNHMLIGSDDELCNQEEQKILMEEYASYGFKISPYIGTHDINEITLTNILGKVHSI
ncbi:MAG: hypothetical protein QNK23_08895 [Crocinitomicaceae bacterium]|nr:hypothetical protein [Crocinitomicaceae bacterium]